MAEQGLIIDLETNTAGELYVWYEGFDAKVNPSIIVDGPGWSATMTPTGDLPYIGTGFVDGETYSLTITATIDGVPGTPTQFTLVAGTDGEWTGFIDTPEAAHGSLTPRYLPLTAGELRPPVSPVGPTTAVAMAATVQWSAAEVDFPSHPAVAFNPAYDPYAGLPPGHTVYWLYYKEPNGTEAFRLFAIPSAQYLTLRLGPDGAMYALYCASTPSGPLFDNVGELYRAPLAMHGEALLQPALLASYEANGIQPPAGGSVFWGADGAVVAAVLHMGPYSTEEDRLVVMGEGSAATLNTISSGESGVSVYGGVTVKTNAGTFVAGGGLPN